MAVPDLAAGRDTRGRLPRAVRGGHDLGTEHGRGRERWRRVLFAAVGAGVFRLVSMAGTLITLPLVLHYLGKSAFGLFSVTTTLASLLAFSDLGLGNGLITSLAEARGRQDLARQRGLVSSAVFLLVLIALVLGALVAAAVPLLDWAALLGAPAELKGEARNAIAVFFACFLVGIPASVGQKIHFAFQEGFVANLWSLGGAVVTIAATVACIAREASLPWLVFATIAPTSLGYLANTAYLFARSHPELRPSLRAVGRSEVGALGSSGALFFVLATSGAVANQTDTLVLSSILGPAAVTTYVVPLRLFTLPLTAAGFLLIPLWPAYTDARARGDGAWLSRTLRRSMTLTGALTVSSAIFLLVFGQHLIRLWVGDQVHVPQSLLVVFAIMTAVNCLQGPVAMFLNGMGIVRFQVVTSILAAVVNLGLSIVLTHRLGVSGPMIATLAATAVCSTVPSLVFTRRLLRRMG